MAAKKETLAEDISDREIITARVFDAPREFVWKAWTEPEHIAQWWGPIGFTTTIHEMDVRPGGAWRFILHGPDGVDYKNHSVFIEVAESMRLVYDHISGPKFHATVTFDDEGGKTKITMRMLFDTAEQHRQVVEQYGAIEGAKQTFARLAEHLTRM
jgi:uncharacterized protein YndB with AHSA1/START domain